MRNTILILTVAMLALAGTTHAQPDSLWSRTFGGGRTDRCNSIIQTADGGYLLAGLTESFGAGDYDMWLVKTDADGDSLWSRTFGGRDIDLCSSIIQTADGGYALAGKTRSFGPGGDDMWLVRTDEDGEFLWWVAVGGIGYDVCSSIIQTVDGGYALAGYTNSYHFSNADFLLVKIDADGDLRWSETYGGNQFDKCYSIIQTVDGGYALAGYTQSYGPDPGDNMWLIRTDAGDRLWSRTFGGGRTDDCFSVIQTDDGGYALAGRTNSFGAGDYDMWLVKTDADGDSLWSRTFGGENVDYCKSIIQTADGGYALAGRTNSFGAGDYDMWLVRTDADGDSLWSLTFGGEDDESCWSIIQTTDGGYALAGGTYSFGAGSADMWLVKTGPDPISVPPAPFIPHPSSFILQEAYPNPFNSTTNIRFGLPKNELVLVKIFDLTGNVIETLIDGRLPAGYHTVSWNSLDYPAGVYICNMQAAGFNEAVKMVLVK
ncbi:T9SS type A sorting domain-containing protein [bacterium]|nr:T9SS type A sorting domain-containing protein [bacterium]